MNSSGANIHSDNEFVVIESLKKLYEIYYDFISNI